MLLLIDSVDSSNKGRYCRQKLKCLFEDSHHSRLLLRLLSVKVCCSTNRFHLLRSRDLGLTVNWGLGQSLILKEYDKLYISVLVSICSKTLHLLTVA